MSNPEKIATFNQATKLLDIFKPISEDKDLFQKILESGFLADVRDSFLKGKGVIRNDLRKVLKLAHYQTVQDAENVLRRDNIHVHPRQYSCSDYEIPYFWETLLWAANQNKNKSRNIHLVEIYKEDGICFGEIVDKIVEEKNLSWFGQLNLNSPCRNVNASINSIFGQCSGVVFERGFYLIDFSGKKIELSGEEKSKRISRLSISEACVFLHILGRHCNTGDFTWLFPSEKKFISFKEGKLSIESNVTSVENLGPLGECIYMIKRDIF